MILNLHLFPCIVDEILASTSEFKLCGLTILLSRDIGSEDKFYFLLKILKIIFIGESGGSAAG